MKGNLSEREQEYLDIWIRESEENRALYNRLQNFGMELNVSEIADFDSNLQWRKVLERARQKGLKKKIVLRRSSLLKYAAFFIGLLGLGYGYWQFYLSDNDVIETEDAVTLELDDGEVRTLIPESSGVITNAQGIVLGQQNGNKLDYSHPSETEKLVYNTLTVPYGRRFSLVLSDNTIVYLNAGSSLKYPVKFIKDQNRRVFLTGEGYFDVTEDKERPFVVTSSTMDVRVLGTKFNVSAYPEDREIHTVLVEGAVSLYSSRDGYDPDKADKLQPGYKAAWDRFYEKVALEQVDTDIYTGWIDGKLVIKKMPFKNILKKMERHYKVSIENRYGGLNNLVFTGTFDSETVEEALRIFTMETPFEYTIDGEDIMIYESKTEN